MKGPLFCTKEVSMPQISLRRLVILSLLAGDTPQGKHAPILGITRLQKLVFLVTSTLGRVAPDRQLTADIDFRAYRFGPADLALYQDLEFLEAVGHIEKVNSRAKLLAAAAESRDDATFEFLMNDDVRPAASPTVEEATENALSFEYLMGDESEAADLAEAEVEPSEYRITDSGIRLLEGLRQASTAGDRELVQRVVTTATDVKTRFGAWPLQRLLRYVYSEYPEMTTASEIRERVLGYEH